MLGVFVVVLKYGAEQAANALRQELDQDQIWTTIVWVQADLLEDKSLIDFIGSAIDMIEENTKCDKMEEEEIIQQQEQMILNLQDMRKGTNLTNRCVGCFVSKHRAKQIFWNPRPALQKQWIGSGTNRTLAVDVEFLKDLSGLHMQSSDLQHIEGIKQRLTVGKYRAVAVHPVEVEDANTCTRCQAVALHAFASLILEGLHFSEVRRITNSDDLQKAQELVQNIPRGTHPIFLWVDMLESLPALTKADRGCTFQYNTNKFNTNISIQTFDRSIR